MSFTSENDPNPFMTELRIFSSLAYRSMSHKRLARLLASMFAFVLGVAFDRRACTYGADDLLALEAQAMKAAVARVAPSVLRIETFGNQQRAGTPLTSSRITSGVAVSEEGHVLSSAFQFAGKPSSILVTLPTGKRAAAQIVARDLSRMLVLLKVTTEEKFTVPEIVPRAEMQVGQWTLAVGKTFDKDFPNRSVGILSAVNRIWGKAIQTDAKISPANYGGPLIDIEGRTLGILVPMSPQQQTEVAGAEWYDSGIGFAIPLADMMPYLEQLKGGKDLRPGLLGISLKSGDVYSLPAEIAAVQPKSPAYKVDLAVGDVIVAVDEQPVSRQVQLRHALGRHYAGDSVSLTVQRGEQRVTVSLKLVDRLAPYTHPFLGLLPARFHNPNQRGIEIRFVYPNSPAAEIGLNSGDRILAIADKDLNVPGDAYTILGSFEPGSKFTMNVVKAGRPETVSLTPTELPTQIPNALPLIQPLGNAADNPAPTGLIPVKLPEEPNECVALVPASYKTGMLHGLVVWLHPSGQFDQERLVERWQRHCNDRHLILLMPQAANQKRWLPTEVDYVRKAIDEIRKAYRIDDTRIVVHGYQAGGVLAYMLAFSQRDLIRGVAAVDAAIPRRLNLPANAPLQRLAIYAASEDESPRASRAAVTLQRLRDLQYPVTTRQTKGYLSEMQIDELVRWIDTLDRL
ncbi:MAG: PDZ domain-containing protein [Planctomycetota bacterium]|nr:PDZ domain-containing protein [Planctomycetota bacterium]